MCPSYKNHVNHITSKQLHTTLSSTFPWYLPLHNYNQVHFLASIDLHNVGVYRRLCQCFQALAWGEISGELEAQMDRAKTEGKMSEKEIFSLTGLPEELFPLGRGLDDNWKGGVEGINSWKDWYEAMALDVSSPVALVFEYPLTLWYLIKKYAPKHIINGISYSPESLQF